MAPESLKGSIGSDHTFASTTSGPRAVTVTSESRPGPGAPGRHSGMLPEIPIAI